MRNKVILMMIMGVALMALPAKAQTFGTRVEQPKAVFHSTSTMMGSGSQYSANPTLNADGTVNEEAYGVGNQDAPKVRRFSGTSGTPGQGGIQQPIGDALIPLMLFAGAYLIIRAARRKVRSMMSERCK